MGIFSDFLRKLVDFISDAEERPEPKTGSGIKELAAKRIQTLQNQWEMVEALVQVASQRRRDLQKQVEKAKAAEASGKRALVEGDMRKAETAMSRYAEMQRIIQPMVSQARQADEQAAAAIENFRAEVQAAGQAASEADMLAQLENAIELQKKHHVLENNQSTIMAEFEAAREDLLWNASAQAAVARIQNDPDAVAAEILLKRKNDELRAIGERWQQEITETDEQQGPKDRSSLAEGDPARNAIRFLEKPPFGGMIHIGSRRNQ